MTKIKSDFYCKKNIKKDDVLFVILPTIAVLTAEKEVSINFLWLFFELEVSFVLES